MTNTKQAHMIAEYYGLDSQMSVAQEECAELIQALSKLRRALCKLSLSGVSEPRGAEYIAARSHVVEEMADVSILLKQLTHLLECDELLKFMITQKLGRTVYRMGAGHEN